MRRHGECDISLQVNGFPASMGIHQNTPIGEKPYEYKEYGKSPVRPGLLCICSVTHTIGECCECNQCGKALSSSCSLQRHDQTHMGKGSDKCEPSSKSLTHPRYLQYRRRPIMKRTSMCGINVVNPLYSHTEELIWE